MKILLSKELSYICFLTNNINELEKVEKELIKFDDNMLLAIHEISIKILSDRKVVKLDEN